MKNYDIIIIHPPRLLKPPYTKNSRFIRGEYIFMPMGLFSIADYLEKEGFGVKIINYPFETYLNPNWKLEDFLKSINFDVCGIDLHWVHNAHGAIEVAKIVKKVNPNAKVILGGYSASYYHEQILKYYSSIVDGIVRGEGELPLLEYVKKVKKNQPLDAVPNLTYQDSSKHTKINSFGYVAKNLDELNFTNLSCLNNAEKYVEFSRKIMGIPYNLSIGRGCPFNCPFCGGGQRAQQRLAGRNEVSLRSPEKVIEDIHELVNKYKASGFFFGHGTYPANLKYWKRLFELIQKEKLNISGDLEIWRLPFPKEMMKSFSKTFTHIHSSISISPRTMSPKVHRKIAEICDPTFKFPQSQINDLIKNAFLFNTQLRIWLTLGYPFQTRLDIVKDLKLLFKIIFKNEKTKSLKPISVMNESFYIFPGSPAHESPESFGVKLKFSSLLEVIEAFKNTKLSFFFNVINYNKRHFSGESILRANKLFFLATIPTLITTLKYF